MYQVNIFNGKHDGHEASWSHFKHPIHRRLDAATKELLESHVKANIRPAEIMTTLWKQPGGTDVRIKDIYNESAMIRKKQLGGKSPTEALLVLLENNNEWIFHYKIDEESRLTHLFFGVKDAVTIWQSHPDIVLADCTYKTNRFGMPLV